MLAVRQSPDLDLLLNRPMMSVFEDLDSDATHVKCVPCSAASDMQDTIILKSGRTGHLTRNKHLEAVASQQAAGAVIGPSHDPVPVQPARFTLSSIFQDFDDEEDIPE